MRLPKDRVLCSNLQTSFTDYDGLLRYLSAERFDGYVALRGSGQAGWLFIADGDVIGARHDQSTPGMSSLAAFEAQARLAGNAMTVYRAPGAQMRLLGQGGEAEPLYSSLPSDFVDVSRMMETLSRGEHTGYVEFVLRDGRTVAYILLEDGAPVEAILSDGGRTDAGLEIVPEILEAVATVGAEITVFRPAESAGAEPSVGDASNDEAGAEEGTATLNDHEAKEVASTWSAIFRAVSEVVDGVAKPGSFDDGLRQALSEHEATYPFLDGGRGRLTYHDGALEFVAPPAATVSSVLGECLAEAIARISFRSRKVDLEARIQKRLETLMETQGAAIRRHGIDRAASPFLAA